MADTDIFLKSNNKLMRLPSGKCLTWLKVEPTADYYISWDAGRASIDSLDYSVYYDYTYSPWTDPFRALSFYRNSTVAEIIVVCTEEVLNTCIQLFAGCTNLSQVDITRMNTTLADNFSYMFMGCTSLGSVDISNLQTGNVKLFTSMFEGCSSLTTLDFSNFDTGSATNFDSMFKDCTTLTTLNLASFNTPSLTSLTSMFSGCTSLVTLDLSNFDLTNISMRLGTFYNCSALRTVYVDHCPDSTVASLLSILNGSWEGTGGGFTLGTRDGRKALVKG